MEKFRVKITRTEVYEREVEVFADDAVAAIAKAKENEQENEYAQLFDMPDDVHTEFSYAGAGEKNVFKIQPFAKLTVTAKVDWDFDEDVVNSGLPFEEFGLPSAKQTIDFTADELKNEGIVDVGDIDEVDWQIDEDKLEDLISDRLTDDTGFCHNGFGFNYKLTY